MDKNGGPNYLEAWRKHRGLSQEELGARVKTNGSQISMLESGERGLSAKWMRKLARALDTEPGLLLEHPPESELGKVISIFSRMRPDQRKMAIGALEGLSQTGQ